MATAALAQLDPTPDGIGIYADLDATQTSITATPGEMIPVYLLITNPSQTAPMLCWAATIIAPDNAEIIAWNVQGDSYLNYATPPEFNVCFTDGVPMQDIMHVMTFIVVMDDDQPGEFYVTASVGAGSGYDHHPVYLVDGDGMAPHWLHNIHGDDDQPVFAINGTITATEPQSWTAIKGLF
jgi:hypothetical protein